MTLCKNCNHEIVKKNGKWIHICRGTLYPEYSIMCMKRRCQCVNPEKKELSKS